MMARFLGGRRISRHDLDCSEGLLAVSLIFIAILMNLPPLSGQHQEGFLSIDCGSSVKSYTDDTTGLKWVTDVNSEYIMTGNSSTPVRVPQTLPNRLSLQQSRFFPESRNKYCYELPTNASSSYLVRVGFYLESVQEPTKFFVYIDATNVFTMTYSPAHSPFKDRLTYIEAIFPFPGDVIYVCLIPEAGWPFISSLELRPLDSSMYTYAGSELQYLVNLVRWNPGAPSSAPLVRSGLINSSVLRDRVRSKSVSIFDAQSGTFPDDAYDRFWYPDAENLSDTLDAVGFVNVNSSPPPDTTIRPEVNCVPPKVMQDACVLPFHNGPSSLDSELPVFFTGPMSLPQADYVYVAVYAENLRSNSEGLGSMTISIDHNSAAVVNVSNQATMAVIPNHIVESAEISIDILSNTSVFIINAMEVYAQSIFDFSSTDSNSERIITAFKRSFNMTNWQGDPCTPVPYDWLSCETDGGGEPTYWISTINLSKLPTGGFTVLQNLLGNFFGGLNQVSGVSITESGVNGSTFQFLINGFNFPFGALQIVDFSNNVIDEVDDSTILDGLTSLNLSHNLLAGPFHMNGSKLSALQELDLSYNGITSFSIPNETQAHLVVLDLSCNQLVDDVSSLDRVVESNALSLQKLYISNNNLTGIFPSTLYFSALPNLTIVNFDGNFINGILNLSLWFNALEENASANSTPMIQRLFSFVNNSISNIYPSANVMEFAISRLTNKFNDFNTGILLGGNPYCQRAESEIQQYLCRPQEYPKRNINKQERDIVIVSITVGVLALLLSGVTIATMWKLWKQVYALRKIQQALADQQVQPPFYQYSDLKSATRNFHPDNKLGHGSFGEVYKGILPDETSVAVKKLFNSQNVQVLHDFLNEVVLITGIKHRNLVQLKGCCIRDKQRMLIYDYIEKGNLAQALWGSRTHGALNWEQRFNICVGVARGLSYLHEELQPSIIHRDIKPENVLLDRNFKAKIADFGLAKHFLEESSTLYTKIAGTLGYFAPEYATQGQLSEKADVYSYGIVVLEVVSGRKCIDHSRPFEKVFLKNWVHAMHRKGMLIDVLEAELRDSCVTTDVIRAIKIGLLCSQTDPERRPSMSQVITMFLGTMDVEISLEEAGESQSEIEDLLVITDSQMEGTAVETAIEEESTEAPLLAASFKSFFRSRESSKSINIEMSDSFKYLGFS